MYSSISESFQTHFPKKEPHNSQPYFILKLPPNHFIHNPHVALYNLYDLGRYVLIHVVGDGEAVATVATKLYGGIYSLEQGVLVNAGDDEVAFVYGFGTLCTCTDADGGEGVAYAGEERRLFGQCAGIRYDGKGVHLQAVVIVKTKRFVLNNTFVEPEAGGGKTVAAAGMTAVEYRHIVLLGHLVDGAEEREKVLFGIDVFLAMRGKKDVLAFFQAKTLMYITCFNFYKVVMQYLCHR